MITNLKVLFCFQSNVVTLCTPFSKILYVDYDILLKGVLVMFKNILKNLLSNPIEKSNYKKNEIEILEKKIYEWDTKSSQIQSKFKFIIPNYIIDEIIENEEKKDYLNLHYLVNCAVINGRISETEGNIIKQAYC